LFDCAGDELLSVSVFRDESSAAASDEVALEFVREELRDYRIERTDMVGTGAVVVSRLADELLEPLAE
jgi:hypothetical protein